MQNFFINITGILIIDGAKNTFININKKDVNILIKGVNRHMIEVLEIGNEYYERALLIVKPEYADIDKEVLEKEAKSIMNKIGTPSCVKKKSSIFSWLLKISIPAILGSLLTLLFMSF